MIEIRDARGCALVADALGFADRDALPPWLVQTAVASGGIALGAFDRNGLVGFSAAIPAEPDALFSCGLAVDPEHRGKGIGRRLKLAQRERALADGRTVIRWTAEPLSASALSLYLSGLGARLVAYGSGLYAAVRPSPVPPDDVTIEWRLDAPPAPEGHPTAMVEVPLDHRRLGDAQLREWRRRVRGGMGAALKRGSVGTAVTVDRATRRAWVRFSEPAT